MSTGKPEYKQRAPYSGPTISTAATFLRAWDEQKKDGNGSYKKAEFSIPGVADWDGNAQTCKFSVFGNSARQCEAMNDGTPVNLKLGLKGGQWDCKPEVIEILVLGHVNQPRAAGKPSPIGAPSDALDFGGVTDESAMPF